MNNPLIFTILGLITISCGVLNRNSDSSFKNQPAVSDINEEKLSIYLSTESPFVSKFKSELAYADLKLGNAIELMGDTPSEFSNCLVQNPHSPTVATSLLDEKCLSIKPSIIDLLVDAKTKYYGLLSWIRPEVFDPKASDTELMNNAVLTKKRNHEIFQIIREKLPRSTEEYDDWHDVDIWWDQILSSSCAGVMGTETHHLCRDLKFIDFMMNESFIALDAYLDSLSTATPNTEAFQKFKTYQNYSMAKLQELLDLQKEVEFKITAINSGNFTSAKADTIPYLAVVADQKELFSHLKGVFESYRQAKIGLFNAIEAFPDSYSALRSIEANLLNESIDEEIYQKEKSHLDSTHNHLAGFMEKSQRQFSGTFLQVVGINENSEAQGEQRTAQVKTGGKTRINLSSGTWETLSLTADISLVRANGIYHNADNSFFLKKLAKKAQKGVQSAYERNKSWLDPAATTAVGMAIPGAGLLGASLDPNGGLFSLGGGVPSSGNVNDMFEKMGKTLKPVTEAAHAAIAGALPQPARSYSDLLQELAANFDQVNPPQITTHVYGLETNVEGYLVSKSVGASANIGNSSGVSTNIGVSGGPVVAEVSGGVSASQGNSAGMGKSVGQNMTVGFYHNRAEVKLAKVGQLIAQVYCDDSTEPITFPVGISNVISRPEGSTSCTEIDLFINDDLAGAKQACESKSLGNFETCSSGGVAVQLKTFKSFRTEFDQLVKIFEDPEFQNLVSEAAYTQDYVGNALRIFRGIANGHKISPEMISRYAPVVEQYANLKHVERQLADLGLEYSRLQASVDKSRNSKALLLAQLDLYRGRQDISEETGLAQMHLNMINYQESLTEIHGKRLEYWLNMYKSSLEYHNLKTKDGLQQLFNFRATKVVKKRSPSEDIEVPVLTWDNGDLVNLEEMFAGLDDEQFIRNQVFQDAQHICMAQIDLGQKPFIKLPEDNPALYSKDLGQFVGASSTDSDYLQLKLRIDPRSLTTAVQVSSIEEKGMLLGQLYCDVSRGLEQAQITSIGLSYKGSSAHPLPSQDVVVEHDHLTFFVQDNQRIYRRILFDIQDRDIGLNADLINSTSARNIARVIRDSNLNEGCFSDLSFSDMKACQRSLLGTLENGEFKRIFLNRYLGGTYTFAFDANAMTEAALSQPEHQLKVFFFVKSRELN